MPRLKACLKCGAWIPELGPPRCSKHQRRRRETPARQRRIRGNRLAVIRRRIFARDNHRCQWPGCGATTELELHHIVAIVDGGAEHDSNRVTLCRLHHKAADDANRRRRRSSPN